MTDRHCEGRSHGQRRALGWDRTRQRQVRHCERIPVAPLRERYLHLKALGNCSLGQLCRHMGWVAPDRSRGGRPRPSVTIAARKLGLRAQSGCRVAETIDYDDAVRLCHLLGLDPHEVGA